jgi:hypothetical protein
MSRVGFHQMRIRIPLDLHAELAEEASKKTMSINAEILGRLKTTTSSFDGTVQRLTDSERQLLLVFVMEAWVRVRSDPAMQAQSSECENIISALSGVETQVICRKTR